MKEEEGGEKEGYGGTEVGGDEIYPYHGKRWTK